MKVDTTTEIVNNPSMVQESPGIKDEKELRRPRSIMKEFSLNTSTHGLPGIARSESIHNCVFWSISFICFTGIMIYFVTIAILEYFKYPAQIDVDIIREWPQYFPAVSICNASPFRLDRFIGAFFNYTKALNVTTPSNATTVPLYLVPYISGFIINMLNKNESMEPYLYSLSSILYKCTYNSVQCSTEDFISFTSASYGFCYTFNAKMKNNNNKSVRYGNEYGGDGILDLELYVHSYQYVPYNWNGFGIMALVHDNTQLPLIEESGIALAPGRKHKLGYKKKTTFLLPSPYTSCTDKISLPMKIMYENYYNGADYGYAETVCYQLCEQTYIYEQCGCVSPTMWNARSIVLPDTNKVISASVCNDTNAGACPFQASNILLSSSSLQAKYCSDCTQQCSITDFIIQNSALASPLEWQFGGIKQFVENSTISLPSDWSTASRTYIQTNYLAVSVVRETSIVDNSTQKAQFGIVDVLSNIGGQTGLWIGISFLSLMEFTEMIYRLIRYRCHLIIQKLRRKKKITST